MPFIENSKKHINGNSANAVRLREVFRIKAKKRLHRTNFRCHLLCKKRTKAAIKNSFGELGVNCYGEEVHMDYQAVNFKNKLALFDEQWSPKVIAEMNDYQFKVVKIQGEFVWHDHMDTDETFIVLEGSLRIDFRDGSVNLSEGEMYVVPKGMEHKPYAEHEAKILLVEPRGVVNTGKETGSKTAENDVWI